MMRPTDLATRGIPLGVLLLLMTVVSSSAQGGDAEDTAKYAMADFLTAWIYGADDDTVKSYFSKSPQSVQLAPDGVWAEHAHDPSALPSGYWDFINRVWQPEIYWGEIQDDLTVMTNIGDALVQTFGEEFGVKVISSGEDVFLAYDLGGHPKPAISGRLKTGHFG